MILFNENHLIEGNFKINKTSKVLDETLKRVKHIQTS